MKNKRIEIVNKNFLVITTNNNNKIAIYGYANMNLNKKYSNICKDIYDVRTMKEEDANLIFGDDINVHNSMKELHRMDNHAQEIFKTTKAYEAIFSILETTNDYCIVKVNFINYFKMITPTSFIYTICNPKISCKDFDKYGYIIGSNVNKVEIITSIFKNSFTKIPQTILARVEHKLVNCLDVMECKLDKKEQTRDYIRYEIIPTNSCYREVEHESVTIYGLDPTNDIDPSHYTNNMKYGFSFHIDEIKSKDFYRGCQQYLN